MQTLLALVLVVGIVGTAEAQKLYRYVDEKGEVHVTDDPNTIPKAKDGKGGAAADPRQPPPQSRKQFLNEEVVYWLPPGFKVDFRAQRGNFSITESVPSGESVKNWTEMVTVTINFGPTNMTLEQYLNRQKDRWAAACKDSRQALVHTGKERGYSVAVFLQTCPLNPATGKPEITFMKAVQGNDNFYSIQRAFKAIPTKEQANGALDFLSGSWVCDTRLPDRACPTARRD